MEIEALKTEICRELNCTWEDVQSENRSREMVFARTLFAYEVRRSGRSLRQIGAEIKRKHPAIIRMIERHENDIERFDPYQKFVSNVMCKIPDDSKILAIDFDGTIVTDAYPRIGEARKDAIKVINKLYDEGFHIIIWTCRNDNALRKMASWLDSNGVKYHGINQAAQFNVRKYATDTRKVYADLYIDDKALFFEHDWMKIYSHVHMRLDEWPDMN